MEYFCFYFIIVIHILHLQEEMADRAVTPPPRAPKECPGAPERPKPRPRGDVPAVPAKKLNFVQNPIRIQ
jgi:hypothetical protein